MTHTKGPWKHYHAKLREQFSTVITEVQDANGEAIVCWGGFDSVKQKPAEIQANSRLIAAAPDLLEALRLADCALSGANMNMKVVQRKVKAAITKATGGRPCA